MSKILDVICQPTRTVNLSVVDFRSAAMPRSHGSLGVFAGRLGGWEEEEEVVVVVVEEDLREAAGSLIEDLERNVLLAVAWRGCGLASAAAS